MGITNRIKQFIDYQGISMRMFCESIGMANGAFAKVKSIGSETLLKIYSAYPNISLEWLITGEGTMFKTKQNVASNAALLEIIKEKDARIEQFIRENERLSIELNQLKKSIPTSVSSSTAKTTVKDA